MSNGAQASPQSSARSSFQSSPRSKVVVVGSGFGGFFAARQLQRAEVDVTVLTATDGFLYQPLLPDVAVGAVDPRSAVVPLSTTLRRATIVRGHAVGVDNDGGALGRACCGLAQELREPRSAVRHDRRDCRRSG